MKNKILKRYFNTIQSCISKMKHIKILLKSEIEPNKNLKEFGALSLELKNLRSEYNYIRFF